MKILNSGDILETIEMLTAENLDVRTVTTVSYTHLTLPTTPYV